jgi:hypothetical protein
MELATGVQLVYRLRADSPVESKEVLALRIVSGGMYQSQ